MNLIFILTGRKTLDNRKKPVEACGPVAKTLLSECERVIIVWDLYPAWREKGMTPFRHEDRQAIDVISAICLKGNWRGIVILEMKTTGCTVRKKNYKKK